MDEAQHKIDRLHTTLSGATIDQIMAELYLRSPAMVCVIAVPDEADPASCTTRAYGHGNRHTQLGMAEMFAQDVIEKLRRSTEPHDPRAAEEEEDTST